MSSRRKAKPKYFLINFLIDLTQFDPPLNEMKMAERMMIANRDGSEQKKTKASLKVICRTTHAERTMLCGPTCSWQRLVFHFNHRPVRVIK